jgi:uncharacterized protein
MEKLIQQLEEEVKKLFKGEASGHDFYHLKRVLNLAVALQEREGGDRKVVAVSAFLHDVHRIIERETGKYCYPKDSLPKVREILDRTDLPEAKKKRVLHSIEFHEEYDFTEAGKSARDIEAQILQDADNLDAIGAVGVARAFAFSGAHGVEIWIPEKPFAGKKYNEARIDASEIHHFYSKLLKLKENMNTRTAKKLAVERHRFMEVFLQEFFEEWDGKK